MFFDVLFLIFSISILQSFTMKKNTFTFNTCMFPCFHTSNAANDKCKRTNEASKNKTIENLICRSIKSNFGLDIIIAIHTINI